MDHDMESSPTASFGINSSLATGGSANAAMVGQIVDSVQTSSLEQSPGAPSESMLETVQRTSQPIQSDAAARASTFAPSGVNGTGVTATAVSREISYERFDGNDRGNPVLLPIQAKSTVVPKPRSRSPTPVAARVGQQEGGRSSGPGTPGSQIIASRQSGRSTPKGGGKGENSFRVVGGADEKLQAGLFKMQRLSASPGNRSDCSIVDMPPGTPERFDIAGPAIRQNIP